MHNQQELLFPHIRAISASAGSGKTHTLMKRYIKFLFSPTYRSLSDILAITFTNKATDEMKKRIIGELKEKALFGDPQKKEIANKRLDELFDRYSDFRIQTIDAFLTSIATVSALELGFPPHFEITLNPEPTFNLVLDELLDKVCPDSNDDITQCFLHFLDELSELKTVPGWNIKKTILDKIDPLINQVTLRGYKIQQIFSHQELKKHQERVKAAVAEFIVMDTDNLTFDKRFTKAVESFLESKEELWKGVWFRKDDLSEICNKGSNITHDHEKIWQGIRNGVSLLSEMTSHQDLCPFIDVMTFFDKALESFKHRNQIIFMTDLNLRLKDLHKQWIVPEIYFYLGDRISHFFIDEFQDTSRLQWENLFPLIEESLARAGSLFYVGDKKQAIYRFRGGDSSLFDEAKDAFHSVDKDNIYEEFPKINYRSREQIISFVNHVFSRDNLQRWTEGKGADPSGIYDTYSHVQQEAKKASGGFVRVQKILLEGKLSKNEMNTELEIQLVSLLKNQILNRFSRCEVAIIVRTNQEAAWITGILSAQNIPVASGKTLDISSNHLICEIVRFLMFLDSPIDNFSFACFISGDIFCKASGLKQEDVSAFLLKSRKNSKALYTLFREEWEQIWNEYIEPCFHSVGFLPVYDLASKIFKEYKIFQNFPEYEGFFCQFLEILIYCESMGANSLKAFFAKWNNTDRTDEEMKIFQVIFPDYVDAVKIWTIHKAKGLQTPVVIIPFAYLNNKSINTVYEIDENDNCIPYRINEKRRSVSPRLEELYQKEFSLQLIDELNAFYVALTRAEDELYLFMPEYKSMGGKLAAPIFFADNHVLEYGEQEDMVCRGGFQTRPKGTEDIYPCQRIYPQMLHEWQDKLANKKKKIRDTAAEKRGRLIHEFLAGIKQLSTEWERDLEAIFTALPDEQQEIIPLMRRFFDSKDVRRWFVLTEIPLKNCELRIANCELKKDRFEIRDSRLQKIEVYCEKEMVDAHGLIHRPDRMLVSPDKVVILEFKTGEVYDESHQQQVREYLSLAADIYPDKRLEGYLVYVDELIQKRVA
ncbi:UvrD-helicase domain-containing protein [Candidatus Desantisbacteria bacterium]|nr:UvrD-helicase domain-containing protein [Candidatus Desantisbacteria bacterium]